MKTLFCFVTAFAAMAGTAFADALEGKRAPAEIIESAAANDWRDVDPAQVMVIDLERGRVTIELSDVFAQAHVAQMKTLAKAGFYNGLSFYRVIDGFVAQGGDPFETKELPDGAIKGLKAEFDIAAAASEVEKGELADFTLGENDGYANSVGWRRGFALGRQKINGESRYHLLHCTGAIAMARDIEKDTGGTEFYITLQPQRYLDR
ncbi:MAG: peptidylprolyl isomerase, partial [Pseudomonadota bacterium]